jgi:transposase
MTSLRKGRGTFENDRPPILGVVGRDSGQIRITVCDNVKQTTIQPKVEHDTKPDVSVSLMRIKYTTILVKQVVAIHLLITHKKNEREMLNDSIR